jgi:hypothetical protein
VEPANATDKTVKWTSGNPSVATVSSSGLITAKAAGSATITAVTTTGSISRSCTVTVGAKTVKDLKISAPPAKTSYFVGETLNTSGLSLKVTYSNDAVEYVSTGFSWTPTALTVAGSQTITVSYGGKTTTFSVTVKADAVSSIALKTMPSKTAYNAGETLNLSGLTLTASYASGKTETVSSGFTCTPTTLNTAGAQIPITVKHTASGTTTSFAVAVAEVKPVADGKISGYVWLEVAKSVPNWFRDLGDTKLVGIPTKLYKEGTTNAIAQTSTDSDGYYEFSNLADANYYVSFEYSGEEYIAEPRVSESNKNVESYSKAKEMSSNRSNPNSLAVATSYVYPVNSTHVNLGLMVRARADLALQYDLYDVTILPEGKTTDYWRSEEPVDVSLSASSGSYMQIRYRVVVLNQGAVPASATFAVNYDSKHLSLTDVTDSTGSSIMNRVKTSSNKIIVDVTGNGEFYGVVGVGERASNYLTFTLTGTESYQEIDSSAEILSFITFAPESFMRMAGYFAGYSMYENGLIDSSCFNEWKDSWAGQFDPNTGLYILPVQDVDSKPGNYVPRVGPDEDDNDDAVQLRITR